MESSNTQTVSDTERISKLEKQLEVVVKATVDLEERLNIVLNGFMALPSHVPAFYNAPIELRIAALKKVSEVAAGVTQV